MSSKMASRIASLIKKNIKKDKMVKEQGVQFKDESDTPPVTKSMMSTFPSYKRICKYHTEPFSKVSRYPSFSKLSPKIQWYMQAILESPRTPGTPATISQRSKTSLSGISSKVSRYSQMVSSTETVKRVSKSSGESYDLSKSSRTENRRISKSSGESYDISKASSNPEKRRMSKTSGESYEIYKASSPDRRRMSKSSYGSYERRSTISSVPEKRRESDSSKTISESQKSDGDSYENVVPTLTSVLKKPKVSLKSLQSTGTESYQTACLEVPLIPRTKRSPFKSAKSVPKRNKVFNQKEVTLNVPFVPTKHSDFSEAVNKQDCNAFCNVKHPKLTVNKDENIGPLIPVQGDIQTKMNSYDLGVVCLNINEKYKCLLEGVHSLIFTSVEGDTEETIEVGSVEFKFTKTGGVQAWDSEEMEIQEKIVQYALGGGGLKVSRNLG